MENKIKFVLLYSTKDKKTFVDLLLREIKKRLKKEFSNLRISTIPVSDHLELKPCNLVLILNDKTYSELLRKHEILLRYFNLGLPTTIYDGYGNVMKSMMLDKEIKKNTDPKTKEVYPHLSNIVQARIEKLMLEYKGKRND